MPEDSVLFYWRPGCPFCVALNRGLTRRGIPFKAVNIWENPEAAARVRAAAGGNETVPTVVVGEQALVNPSVAQVMSLIEAEAPQLAATLAATPAPRRRKWFSR
jgi:glutaredoxin-like protein